MNKCFITKLPSSVDNNNLPVLGQLRIKWLKKDSLKDKGTRVIKLKANDDVTVKVSGAHFTDPTLTSNNGNIQTIKAGNDVTSLAISNDADAVLTIDNKYALTVLDFGSSNKYNENIPAYFDIEDIKYCTNLIELTLSNTQIGGDISAVSNMTNMQNLVLHNTQIGGDISAVSNMTNMQYLSLFNTQIGGDISAISNMTNMQNLDLSNIQIGGDISAISNMTNMQNLVLHNTQIGGDISAVSNMTNIWTLDLNDTNVSGNVASFARFINLINFTSLKGISLAGDMSKLPAQAYWISQQRRKINTNFTWTAKGRQNATLLALEGDIPFDTASMDNMLIDQATCKLSQSAINNVWAKVISVSGTRTSASDAAVTTLQNMGVTITGVTKQA